MSASEQTKRRNPMKNTKSTAEGLAAATTALVEAREGLSTWTSRLRDAETRLQELDATSGDQVLDGEVSPEELAAQMREQRDLIATAEKAIAAQLARVDAAECAYLAAQADELERTEVQPAQAALDAHQVRTRELLDELAAHDGPYVTEYQLKRSRSFDGGEARTTRLPKSVVLSRAVSRARLSVEVLRTMSRREDPTPLAAKLTEGVPADELWPACVRPGGGLVLAPAFQERIEDARRKVRDLEAEPAQLEAEIEQQHEDARADYYYSPDEAIARREARLEQIGPELEQARRELAELTGNAHPNAAAAPHPEPSVA